MALPSPENYTSWQEFARALISAIEESDAIGTGVVGGSTGVGPVTGGEGQVPDGFSPVWLSDLDAQLYLGNNAFDPPTAPNLFQIDTANIADAAIVTTSIANGAVDFYKIFDGAVGSQKLADLAVTNAKLGTAAVGTANIIDAAVVTAKIANAAIVTALIGDAQIVNAKIADLAVNTAKIANVAVTSAKIANLAVGTAHIQDAAIVNAKIGNTISSGTWDGVHGWNIDKTGAITGTQISILNSDGSIAFSSGSQLQSFINPEFIYNGNAELGTTLGWASVQTSGAGGFIAVYSGDKVSGTSCFAVNKSATGNGIAFGNRAFPVSPGDVLHVRLWLKGSSATASGLYIRMAYKATKPPGETVDFNGGVNQFDTHTELVPGNSAIPGAWTLYDFTTTVPAGQYWATLAFYNWVNGPTLMVVDNVSVQRQIASTDVSGLGTLALLNSITPANTTGFGALAVANFVTLGTGTVTGTLPLSSTSGNLDISRTTGFGSLAAVSLLNSGNIGTYIAGAAIGSALIANLAVGTAAIDNAAVTTAKIANLAVGNAQIANLAVDSAKIANAAITSAKIGNLQVTSAQIDNLTVGTDKIAYNAATSMLASETSGDTINGADATDHYYASVTIPNNTGQPVRIDFQYMTNQPSVPGIGTSPPLTIQVERVQPSGTTVLASASYNGKMLLDTPTAQTYVTYRIKIKHQFSGNASTLTNVIFTQLFALEVKR